MEIIISETYDALSGQAALTVKELARLRQHPLLCTASGDTPAGLYKELVALAGKKELDTSSWNFVGLDEWVGMNGNDEGSCRYYLDRQLFNPLDVKADRISFFDGKADDLQSECENTETFIRQHEGIDIAILGLGMNGHIGMNEPGSSPALRSHVRALDAVTQTVGQKYFSEKKDITHGITLGLATLMAARHLILLVSGRHKAEIVKRVLEEDIAEQLPASLMRNHKNLSVFLDREAALLLHSV